MTQIIDPIQTREAPTSATGFVGTRETQDQHLDALGRYHWGSLFRPEMFATIAGVRPRCAPAPATSESDQPHS